MYRGTPVDVDTDPELYRAVAEAFPDAYLEDPDLNDETREVLEPHADRVTWDAPLHSLADVKEMARKAINSKPSRFGSLQELLDDLRVLRARTGSRSTAAARARFSAGAARSSTWPRCFTPSTPNDVAPRATTTRRCPTGMPTSPMDPAPERDRLSLGRVGFAHGREEEAKSFADALNEQIANEFGASMQYIGAAVHYDAETLPRLAAFFYRQARRGAQPRDDDGPVPARRRRAGPDPRHRGPADEVHDAVAPVRMALEQEKRVGEEIYNLFELAREAKDYRAEQFMQWFVKEQVEEVALMQDLLNVVERSQDNLLLVEDFIAREAPGEDGGEDRPPRRPPAAERAPRRRRPYPGRPSRSD